jgi:hypothetical protein
MVFGSDAGVMPHGTAAVSSAPWSNMGMTRWRRSRPPPATRPGAGAGSGTSAQSPSAATGDIIAVDGDPIADVRQLEDVDVVIKGGKVEKNE